MSNDPERDRFTYDALIRDLRECDDVQRVIRAALADPKNRRHKSFSKMVRAQPELLAPLRDSSPEQAAPPGEHEKPRRGWIRAGGKTGKAQRARRSREEA